MVNCLKAVEESRPGGDRTQRCFSTLRGRPPRPGSACCRNDGSHFAFAQWPPALRREFETFRAWATQPVVNGRDARLRKRPTTAGMYQKDFEMYFGFLLHIRHERHLSFDQLFNLPFIQAFIDWHVNVKHQRVTVTAHRFLQELLAITRQYRPQPELRTQLLALKRTLPTPTLTYQKNHAWVPLAEQERVGLALWPQPLPSHWRTNGRRYALRASLSLMFRLWVRIPYRPRNMREMRLDENLHRDPQSRWRLRFAGEQLKVAVRKGYPNVFDLPFPNDLVPTLEEYLQAWRPRLIADDSHSQLVFPTSIGTRYSGESLRHITNAVIYRYTGKHWHPHIIRTVWATEYIRTTGDFYGAAIMLNDTLETVIRRYAYLREENVADQAFHWVHSTLAPGLTP